VRNLASYGAFVEIEEGIDGLLHVSDMSWTKKVSHPSEMLKKGDKVEAVVLSVNQEKKRVALGLKQLKPDPWQAEIPTKYHVGDIARGKVTKLTSFGVFVELEPELEGLLHISELADRKVETPEEVVKVGEDLEVRVIKVDTRDRKIGLSLRQVKHADAETERAIEDRTEREVFEDVTRDKPLQTVIEGLDAVASRLKKSAPPPEGGQTDESEQPPSSQG
jgi:small subunit ribosomal protein S1